jgi:hypothetical protein
MPPARLVLGHAIVKTNIFNVLAYLGLRDVL